MDPSMLTALKPAPSFQGKVVIVTGASNGVGAVTATLFAEQGANIAAIDIRDPIALPTGTRIDLKCDISQEDQVIAAVKQIVDKFGTIDVLCNVAGVTDDFAPIHETTPAAFARVLAVNTIGPFNLMHHVIPHFLAKPGVAIGQGVTTQILSKGVVVNVGSMASTHGASAGTAYTASKHALLGLSRNTAWMYAKDGVRTNTVLPGGVMTNIMANSGLKVDEYGRPLGLNLAGSLRLKPSHDAMPAALMASDVARAILYLAGAEGVNGAELTVDQGWGTA